jgi:hypothetical protein
LGAGVPLTGFPFTLRSTKLVPAALTPNAPVELFRLAVLTDFTAVAETRPLSTLADCTVDDPVAATPVAVPRDAALVSTVPVVSAGRAFTDAAVLVWLTPVCETQPRLASAESPDLTSGPTVTWVP